MAGFIDIACNFTHPSFKNNLDQVISDAKALDVKKFVLLCASLEDLQPIRSIQSMNPSQFFITAGIHPHHANEILQLNEMPLIEKLSSIEPDAIGETGLDFYYDNSDRNKQIKSFKIHIEAALKANIPIIIHSRNAEEKTFEVLNEYKYEKLKILMHCFTGSQKFAEQLLKFNSYFLFYFRVQ